MSHFFEELMEEAEDFNKQPGKVQRFIKEALRVLRVTKKPNKEEYLAVVKVTSLGIGIIGAIGFVIFLIDQAIF